VLGNIDEIAHSLPVVAVLALHHVRNLDLLRKWAHSSLAGSVPESTGAWDDVFTMLHRRQRDEVGRRRQLARLLARSRRAGRALPYGLAIVDDEYRILWCNDSCESHFGIDAEGDAGGGACELLGQDRERDRIAAAAAGSSGLASAVASDQAAPPAPTAPAPTEAPVG